MYIQRKISSVKSRCVANKRKHFEKRSQRLAGIRYHVLLHQSFLQFLPTCLILSVPKKELVSLLSTLQLENTICAVSVLAGSGEAASEASGTDSGRPSAAVLCQVLHTRPCSTGGRVHSLSVLSASQARPLTRPHPMQREHRSTHGLLHRTR